jgi:hypothetical protein
MNRRVYLGLLAALGFLIAGMLFWRQYKEANSHWITASPLQIVDQQINDIQNSKYLTPEQKEKRIAQVRAMNARIDRNAKVNQR